VGRALVGLVLCVCICEGVAQSSGAASTSSAGSASAFVRANQLAPESAPPGSIALGPVAGNQRIALSVVLAPAHRSQLQSLLKNLYNPKSSKYHQWLRSGQFLSEFGPSSADVATAESWLHAKGLTQTTLSGFAVHVSATESRVSAALGTSFERYRMSTGNVGFVAKQAPLVPQPLASSGQIATILGLDTLSTMEPLSASTPAARSDDAPALQPDADGLTPCAAAQTAAAPGYYTLDALGAAYGIGSLLADGQNGNGETIGVFELGQAVGTDISTYESCFGLTNAVYADVVDGGASAGASGTAEADADIEQVATQAPGATIVSYEGPNTASGQYDIWDAIVVDDAARVVSTSWGSCEPLVTEADTTLFEQAAAQGQTILAATGDSGSEGCYVQDSSTAEEVSYPASDPWVTAVGGTYRYFNGTETAWNYCQSDESIACANAYNGLAAGGGGMSRYEPKLSYQPEILEWSVAQPCGTVCREVPDLSANAGVGMVIFANGTWDAYGGTSLAAPFVAGLIADKNGGCTSPTGVFTPALYALWSEGVYGSALNDITQGNTDMTGSNGGAYPATSGYNAATGLGSPIAEGLSCPEVTSVNPGYSGATVTVSGLGLEHATITFGGTSAQVLSASATTATVVVPTGSGTVTVAGTSVLGSGTGTAAFVYGSPPPPVQPPPSTPSSGYDLVGRDGGVFVFPTNQSGGFYGSLPGLGVHVSNIVGMVPTSTDQGYFLVGSDGGVFAFGNAPFFGSLPGDRAHINDVVGIVPTSTDQGYFLVGRDGGVFAFGNAAFLGSLPGRGIHVDNIIGIAANPSDQGYWLIAANGQVFAFGNAVNFGSATGSSSPVTAIESTPDGGGYWVVFQNGSVFTYGDAGFHGSLPGLGVTPAHPVIGLVPTADDGGYWLIGSDGGIFAFGDAPFVGSLPGLGVSVTDVVGSVPTKA
jgi:hypothetical protein